MQESYWKSLLQHIVSTKTWTTSKLGASIMCRDGWSGLIMASNGQTWLVMGLVVLNRSREQQLRDQQPVICWFRQVIPSLTLTHMYLVLSLTTWPIRAFFLVCLFVLACYRYSAICAALCNSCSIALRGDSSCNVLRNPQFIHNNSTRAPEGMNPKLQVWSIDP